MTHMKEKKRFIAGAICQACGKLDRVVSWSDGEDNTIHLECISCGYSDKQTIKETSEISTRVNQENSGLSEEVLELKIISLTNPKSNF